MALSMIAYWPGMTDDQAAWQPGLKNGSEWAAWRMRIEGDPVVAARLQSLKCTALLTLLNAEDQGRPDVAVEWVTPHDLAAAADRLRTAVLGDGALEQELLADHYYEAEGATPAESFAQDLSDIESLAQWAGVQGADKLTLEFGF